MCEKNQKALASTEMGNFSTSQETISFSSTALIYGVQHLIHTFYSGDLHIPQCLVVLCGTNDRLQISITYKATV